MADYRDISTLHNWEHNPRSMTKDGLARLIKQIKKLGVYKPLVITEDGTVLGGNMRLQALRELGQKQVWVSVVDAPSEEKKIEYALSDNDRAGKYEADQLANLIGNFPDVEWGDFTVDIKEPELVSDLMDKFSETEEDEAPEVQEGEAGSKLGEVYQLGRHRLMCGDSTDAGSVAILMNGQKADMVFTDPPYNVAEDSENYASNVSKAMNDLKNSKWDKDFNPEQFIKLLPTVIKEDSFLYIFTSHRLFGQIIDLLEELFGKSSFLVWCKPNPMPSLSKTTWTFATELIAMSRIGKPIFNYPDGENCLNWININKKSDGSHPTQKPIELCSKIIKYSSKADDIVLDLFGGSGSTLIACEQTNRTCYMMELDPHYCDVIRKRYDNFVHKSGQEQDKNAKH